jgi:hypothetical protein
MSDHPGLGDRIPSPWPSCYHPPRVKSRSFVVVVVVVVVIFFVP